MPARRSAAAIGAAVALAAGALALAPSALAASPARSGDGRATATVLRADLDASLLQGQGGVPVHVVLDDVHAPADTHQNTLHANVQVPVNGQRFTVLTADVASATATADQHKAEGYANLVNAKVELPGLPGPVLQAKALTARATCVAGEQPTANASLLKLVVLGRAQEVKVGQTVTVPVPGVGQVSVALTTTKTTSSTAAATALGLHVSVNPLKAGIADVTGDVTLAHATCEAPSGGGSSTGGSSSGGSSSGGSSSGGSTSGSTGGGSTSGGSTGGSTGGGSASGGSQGASSGTTAGSQTAGTGKNLAETGASSSTPYIAGGAAALIVAGGAAVYVTRRRKSSSARG
ncbi:LPXTG cell wall anchor domain-containing protein [Streptomyces sp. RB6PN25]|uniref:LPXTG cell wall anchor domain-containing protein n=1 Tax=Streptomyces humicola TaxID=2953240 RepID=A0ABT1Q4I3_9ACTN|nr:SCO1860 family LAETG-anchored protein [Streptomyces humicola]MCQ4083690.1 LPXTG cell wall anchor domain-containing protein [Streptomyces humicola]